MLQVAIIPGPRKPKDLYSFLSPLMEDLERLSTQGMILKVDGELDDIHLKVNLLLASGDIPGIADFIHHSGHGSRYGCRICRIYGVSERSPNGIGHGIYFPGDIGLEEERTVLEFKGENTVSLKRFTLN